MVAATRHRNGDRRPLHLIVDGYGADRKRLQDEGLVHRFLDEYPEKIGMTKMIAPQVYTYRGRVPEDWGISGFVLIAESHISVHTFPDRGYVNIDVFSLQELRRCRVRESDRTGLRPHGCQSIYPGARPGALDP